MTKEEAQILINQLKNNYINNIEQIVNIYYNEPNEKQELLKSAGITFNSAPQSTQSQNENLNIEKAPILLLKTYYPQFEKEYQILIDNGYILVKDKILIWLKSKQCLAEYFGFQPSKDKKTHWKQIEIVFETQNLKQSFYNSENKNQSNDYKELKKILQKFTQK